MSGALHPDPEDLVVLTGEYVLGTLPRDDAARLAREAQADPAIADAIRAWEEQLAPLGLLVTPQTPPADLWPRIRASLRGDGAVPFLAVRRPTRRQAAAYGAMLAAACLAVFALVRPAEQSVLRPVAALVSPGASQPVFVLAADAGGGLLLTPLAPVDVPAGRRLELWAKSGPEQPHSLGWIDARGTRLPPGVQLGAGAQLMVTLEPAQPQPLAAPSGPLLWTGVLASADRTVRAQPG